ncbi:M28 family peptidase [Candidatus Eisenbacteria bacterium]|uniref:M28 family peptidase n=1 Tax=Eiseniibacteriota bacterium TaxID=2212470 RepID=A0ABV6YIY8_UNCEI
MPKHAPAVSHASLSARIACLLFVLALFGPSISWHAGADVPEGVMGPAAVLRESSETGIERTAALDSVITHAIGQISEMEIYTFLEQLTGEVPVQLDIGERTIATRFSASDGAQQAAEFLSDFFNANGYEVDHQVFRFPNNLFGIHVNPAGDGIFAGQYGQILWTEDGEAWTRTKNGIDHVTEMFNDVGAVGAAGSVVVSENGGDSWAVASSGVTMDLQAVDLLSYGFGWAVGNLGTIIRTVDGGETWTVQSSGVVSHLYDVTALSATSAVAVGAGGTILKTTNGGSSWSPRSSGVTLDLRGVDSSPSGLLAVGATGTALRSTNLGEDWFPTTTGVMGYLMDISIAGASSIAWAVGTAGGIVYTTDFGDNWVTQTSPSMVTLTSVSAVSGDEAWACATGGHILRTIDAGDAWEDRDHTIDAGWVNVEATMTGSSYPEEEVLLVGHFDSVSEISMELAPGADDNGSGIAVIHEVARAMRWIPWERTIRFVCFSGEEQGKYGSYAYVAQAVNEGRQIVAAFNLDSVGWNDTYFRIFSNETSGWLGDLADAAAAEYAPGLPTYHWFCPDCTWSDHYPFWVAGFDAICGIETWEPAPPQHHSTADTLGLLDIPLIVDVTKISIATIATVAGYDSLAPPPQGVDANDSVLRLCLHTARPNPTSSQALLRFSLPNTADALLQVYSPDGRVVRTLVDESRAAGEHVLAWDGRDQDGRRLGSGLYFYRLNVDDQVLTRKVMIAR